MDLISQYRCQSRTAVAADGSQRRYLLMLFGWLQRVIAGMEYTEDFYLQNLAKMQLDKQGAGPLGE